MLDLLPDLSGQPAWVVVVVMALFVAGTVGVKWVGVRAGRDSEEEAEAESDRPASAQHSAVSGSDAHTTLVLTKALDLLANEATESQGARAEADRLRDQLLECSAERERLARNLANTQAELDRCNEECQELARRALERGGDSGE